MTRSYVYAIEHPDGYYKIGKSQNPVNRFGGIQTGSPYDLELRFLLEFWEKSYPLDSPDLEKLVHEHFHPHNVRGEWFDVDLVDIYQLFAWTIRDEHWPGDELFHVGRERDKKRQEESGLYGYYGGPL